MLKNLTTLSPVNQLETLGQFDYTLNCGACELRSGCMSPLAPNISRFPQYPQNCDLMIIADRPSFEEESCANGWGDRHSKYVSNLISSIFPSYNLYFTYLTKCFSGTYTVLGKKNTEICIRTWLNNEYTTVKPKKQLLLGQCGRLLFKLKFGENKLNAWSWKSANFIFNSGKKEEEKFIKFLHQIKETKV